MYIGSDQLWQGVQSHQARTYELKSLAKQVKAKEEGLRDRAEQELRLHNAIEEIYGEEPNNGLEKQVDQMIKASGLKDDDVVVKEIEPSAPTSVEAETIPEERGIMSFEIAKKILVPLMSDFEEGPVLLEDFEEAYKFFVALGSDDLEESYLKEKKEIAQTQKESQGSIYTLEGATAKLKEIQGRIRTGGEGSQALSKALNKRGYGEGIINSLVDAAEIQGGFAEIAKNELSQSPFTDNFAKVFFFFREQAPEDMADGRVFEDFVKPFFEMIAQRATDADDLKKPIRPDRTKYKKANTFRNKLKQYERRNKAYPVKVKASVPEMYQFVIDKLGKAPELVAQRLEELSSHQ